MPRYEILIPASDATGFSITVRLDADSWINALKTGLAKLELPTAIQNILVDIKDDGTIHVTEPDSGRVLRMRDISDEAPAPLAAAKPPPPPAEAPLQPAPKAIPLTEPKAPLPLTRRKPIEAAEAPIELVQTPPAPAEIGRRKPMTLDEMRRKTMNEMLAALFERCQDVYTAAKTPRDAANFFMDIAINVISAESGAVFMTELESTDLYFAAARGPKADDVMSFRVPMGQGIVGFSALHGVALAVSDVEKDPRFYATISKRIGYPTHSLACAPVQKDGRVFGAIELVNRVGGSVFTNEELEVLGYLGDRFADYLDLYHSRDEAGA